MAGNDGDKFLAQEQQFPLKREAERDPESPTNEEILEVLQDFIEETSSHNDTENEFPATVAPVRDEIDNGDKANAKSGVEGSKTKVEAQEVRDSQSSVGEGDGGSTSDSAEIVEEQDPATNEVKAISSSETSTNINKPQCEIPQDNSPESTGGTVTRDTSLSSQIPSDNEQDTHLETTAAQTPDEIENGEDDEVESENESKSAKNFEDDILWNDDSDSQSMRTPEEKDLQATPDFIKMMAERELEFAQKEFQEKATEEAIKELARQNFGPNVPDLDQALIQEQMEIYKMIQMDREALKASRSGQTGGDASSAPWDPRSVEGGDVQQSEVWVESSAEQADEQASGLVTQTSGHNQIQSDTASDSMQATASSVPDRVVDDLDEETNSVAGASEASVSDSTIYGEGYLIKPTLEEGTRSIDDAIDQEKLEFAVEMMGEDMQKLKLDEEEYFKKREEEKRKWSEDSSSKASSSEDKDSKKEEDDRDDEGSPDDSPRDDSSPYDSPPNNSPSDHSPQDDHEDPSQNGAPRDTQDGNSHQFSQGGDLSDEFQDNGIAERDDSQNDAPQTLMSSDKKSNDLPPVLKLTPKATIQQLISEVKEWALLTLSRSDSKDFPGGALQNIIQRLVNFGEVILRICHEKNGRGAREGDGGKVGGGENGDVDMSSLIEMLTAWKLAGNGIEPANGVSQQEESKDVDEEIPKLIPDCSLRKSIDDQEAVSENKAEPSVDAEEAVDVGPLNEEQTNLTESSSSDHETKEDLATIAEKVLHWAYEGFEKEYFRPRPEYNNYTNRLAEDLWKRQYQLRIAEFEFEAEKARVRDREFDMTELEKRENAVKVREGVLKEFERLLIERDRKLLEREGKMNRMERKSKEGKKDEDREGGGEDGDGEKKCKSQ